IPCAYMGNTVWLASIRPTPSQIATIQSRPFEGALVCIPSIVRIVRRHAAEELQMQGTVQPMQTTVSPRPRSTVDTVLSQISLQHGAGMKRRNLLQWSALAGPAASVPQHAPGKQNANPGTTAPPAAKSITPLKPPAGPIPVAFLISEGAVVIDFAGPWEV